MKILHTVFGSKLYGTSTPTSDTDQKIIFADSLFNIINNKSKSVDVKKVDGNDIETFELRKYLHDLLSGQTYAYDVFFSLPNNWYYTSEVWDNIISHRDKVVSKTIEPFIGYSKHQAEKYGAKGEKLKDLELLISDLEKVKQNKLFKDCLEDNEISSNPSISFLEEDGYNFIKIFDKQYLLNSQVGTALKSLIKIRNKYGKRSYNSINGTDWKALSHSFRILYEMEEILVDGKITFPSKKRDFILDVKTKKLETDVDQVKQFLIDEHARVFKLFEISTLQDKPDYDFWEQWIYEFYINGKLI